MSLEYSLRNVTGYFNDVVQGKFNQLKDVGGYATLFIAPSQNKNQMKPKFSKLYEQDDIISGQITVTDNTQP